jgi:hypothetical protein
MTSNFGSFVGGLREGSSDLQEFLRDPVGTLAQQDQVVTIVRARPAVASATDFMPRMGHLAESLQHRVLDQAIA